MYSKNKINWNYEIPMLILSLLAVALAVISLKELLPEYNKELRIADTIILIIFFIDYAIRFRKAKHKWKFVKRNWIDLISIIPFDAVFLLARATNILRFLRLLKLLRVLAVFARFERRLNRFFIGHHFHYVLIVTMSIVVLGAFSIEASEGLSFYDSIWWAFVTVTTVGYGDISPKTPIGRIIAGILMMLGIGFIGALTSNITAFILEKRNDRKIKSTVETVLDSLKEKLDNFDELTEKDIDEMHMILKALRRNNPIKDIASDVE